MRYSLIYADPPWWYPDRPVDNGGITYDRMKLEELVALKPLIDGFAAHPCALAMWYTGPHTPTAMQLGEGLGFQWVTVLMTWCKTIHGEGQGRLIAPESVDDWNVYTGPGRYTKHATEYLGLWRRGSLAAPEDKTIRQVIHAPVREHSRKPDEARRRLERLWPEATRLEMFARTRAPGWDAHGNETEKFPQGTRGEP